MAGEACDRNAFPDPHPYTITTDRSSCLSSIDFQYTIFAGVLCVGVGAGAVHGDSCSKYVGALVCVGKIRLLLEAGPRGPS